MKSFTKSYVIHAPLKSVWACLADEKLINKWGAYPASMKAKAGGTFAMWGDYLTGTITKIDEPYILVQDWIVDGMSNPSQVTFSLSNKNNTTELVLTHENIPDDLFEELRSGWDEFYIGAISSYLDTKS